MKSFILTNSFYSSLAVKSCQPEEDKKAIDESWRDISHLSIEDQINSWKTCSADIKGGRMLWLYIMRWFKEITISYVSYWLHCMLFLIFYVLLGFHTIRMSAYSEFIANYISIASLWLSTTTDNPLSNKSLAKSNQ